MLSDGRRGFIPPATGPGDAWVGSAVPVARRPGVAAGSAAWVSDGLPCSAPLGVVGRGAGLARPQGRWPPLLDRPRVTANGSEIRGHGRGFPRPGGIMFPQEIPRWIA